MKRRVTFIFCLAVASSLALPAVLRAQELSAREKTILAAISKKEGEKALKLLRSSSSVDVNMVDPTGRTLLMNAVASGLADLVKEVIDRGANVNTKSKEGQTALMLAADFGNVDVLRLLLSKGADLKLKDQDDWTALQYATMRVQGTTDEKKKTYEEIVRILKEAEKPQTEQASNRPS